MTPRSWLIAGAAAVLLAVVGVFTWHHVAHKADTAAIAQADQHHVAAVASAAQGAVYDQQAQTQAPQIQNDSAEVARLRAQLAALRARPVPPPATPGSDPQPVAASPDLVAVVASQDALIKAQDQQIQDQTVQIHTLTLARDSWKSAYEASTKEASALRIAHEAALAEARSSKWVGRIQGFAVGAALGYAGGKL